MSVSVWAGSYRRVTRRCRPRPGRVGPVPSRTGGCEALRLYPFDSSSGHEVQTPVGSGFLGGGTRTEARLSCGGEAKRCVRKCPGNGAGAFRKRPVSSLRSSLPALRGRRGPTSSPGYSHCVKHHPHVAPYRKGCGPCEKQLSPRLGRLPWVFDQTQSARGEEKGRAFADPGAFDCTS